jgi:predicted nucleic acid-binding protein
MKTEFVLDASVLVGWLSPRQADAYSDAIRAMLETAYALAPALLRAEYVNFLCTQVKKGVFSDQRARELLALLGTLPIRLDRTPPSDATLLSIALQFGLTSYDALYLELSMRAGLPLATRDDALRAAAGAARVGLVPGFPA